MQLFGIIAHPAAHSLSPIVHNAAFKELGIRAEYREFDVPPERLDEFFAKAKERKIGLSVSMPHKESVKKYCDRVTNAAEKIGAINTLYWKDQDLMGHNTDFMGINKPLLEKTDIEDKNVVILGAGGAARAAVYACTVYGANVTVLNRTLENAAQLSKEFKCKYGDLSAYKKEKADIIIHTSSVGMMTEDTLLEETDFRPGQIVFDCVYRPKETQFLKNAQKAGADIIPGYKMFLEQACEQFKLFTGKNAPREVMEKVLLEELAKDES